jgi:GAF domain-containing protein
MTDGEIGQRLARTLGDLAVRMQAQTSSEDTLHVIADAAAHIVPGARWAGISLISGRKIKAHVPTDPVVAKLDNLQSELGDGPCITALREYHTVHVADMAVDTRWPEFALLARELGVGSLMSFQLFVQRENLGALNLYGGEPGVFGSDSVEVGTILAQHAAVAMMGATNEDRFASAVASRDDIGQAKGILMHRDHLTGLQAFNVLVRASQETNMKLIDVARWLISEHEQGVRGGDVLTSAQGCVAP